jgi:hypothetical protein
MALDSCNWVLVRNLQNILEKNKRGNIFKKKFLLKAHCTSNVTRRLPGMESFVPDNL